MISLSVALLTALLRPPPSNWAARTPATQRITPQIRMAAPSTLPRNIKEVVAQMKDAVQTALQNRISRIDVELPLATRAALHAETQADCLHLEVTLANVRASATASDAGWKRRSSPK